MSFEFEESVTIDGIRNGTQKFKPVAEEHFYELWETLCETYLTEVGTELRDRNDYIGLASMGFAGVEYLKNALDSIIIRQARDTSAPDGVVELSFRVYDDVLRVEVKDNGTGVEPTLDDLLFKEDFSSEKGPLKDTLGLQGKKGYGLEQIGRKMKWCGGQAGYENLGENEGAVFWYEIPLESLEQD